MDKNKLAKDLVNEALQAVKTTLEAQDPSFDLYMRNQLTSFKEELTDMITQLDNGSLPSSAARKKGMGKVIVDSWPTDSKLGDLIIKAERAFIEA